MRKEYASALREQFTHELSKMCPELMLAKKYSAAVRFPGERAYCSKVSESVLQWVVLVPDGKRDAFFIEVGWSKRGRFPQLTMRPSWVRPAECGSQEEYLCRLRELSAASDSVWIVEDLPLASNPQAWMDYLTAQSRPISDEVAATRVRPHVKAAPRELAEFGLPFLRRHAASL
jgi:hypothetical protein